MQVNTVPRVLLAGIGAIGKRHARVLSELGVTGMAAVDPSREALEALRAIAMDWALYMDYGKALADYRPEAVFVMTPTAMHLEMAKSAILAGAHVFIEKPLASTSKGVVQLKELARVNEKQVMVGFCFRYHEALGMAKTLLGEGVIGRLVSIRALMGEPFFDIHPDYMDLYYSKYSGAFELVHDLDLAIWFAGQSVAEVLGFHGSYSDMGMHSPDVVEMLLRFEDRCLANVHLDFFQTPRRRQMDLIGTKGVITVEFSSWDSAKLSVFTRDNMAWEHRVVATQRDDMFRQMDKEFLDCIQTGRPNTCNIDEAFKSLQVVEAIYSPESP